MKFRKSFVTNSSSSSYICDYCGNEASGWDLCMSDAEMIECINGHTVCEAHLKNEDLDYLYNTYGNEDSEEFWEDWRYELPEKYCPICNFQVFLDSDLLKYLEKFHHIVLDDIKKEIKENFDSYSDFKKKINS